MPTLVDILKYQLVLDDSQFKATAAQADAQANQLAGSIGGKLTTAVGLLAGAFTALKIGDFLKDATLTAARTEVLGTALSVVGKNAGVSQGELALLEEQVKALGITTQEARTSIIRFIQSGLPLSKIAELARLAQDSAVTAGINSSEAFERLTRGIQTGQIELLRTAGVFVSIESELNKFAKSTGKAREGLSDIERQTVILNAVLAQGSKLAGNYEAAMGDVGKQLTSLPRFFEEFSNALGSRFLPALEAYVVGLTELLKKAREFLSDDLIVRAEDFFKSGSKEAERIKLVNDLTEKKIALENKLRDTMVDVFNQAAANDKSFSSGVQAIFDVLSGKGSNDLSAGGAIGKAIQAISLYDLSRISQQLEDVTRQLEGLEEKKKDTFVGPIDERAQIATAQAEAEAERIARKAEDRAKRQADRLAELAKTPTIGGDIAEGIDKQWEIAKAAILAEPIEVEVDFTIPTSESQKIQNEIDKIFKSNAPDQGPLFDILGIQDLVEENNRAAQQMQDDLTDAFYEVGAVAGSVFRNIGGQAGQLFDSVFNSFANLSTGNLAAGIAGAIDAFAGIFSGGSEFHTSTLKLIRSEQDLIRAIEDWQDSIIGLTAQEAEDRRQAATQGINLLDRGREPRPSDIAEARAIAESMGFDTKGMSWQDLLALFRDVLKGVNDFADKFDELKNADQAAERRQLAAGARNFEEFQFFLDGFETLFGISIEEQIALWEDFLAKFGATLSPEDFLAATQNLKDLQEARESGATQTERSIARVTERQADSLISGIATMDLHLREGFQAVVNAIMSTVADASDRLNGGTEVTIGAINVYPPTADGRDMAKALVSEMSRAIRSVGSVRLA